LPNITFFNIDPDTAANYNHSGYVISRYTSMKSKALLAAVLLIIASAGACSPPEENEPATSTPPSTSTCPISVLGEAEVRGAVYYNGNLITGYTDFGAHIGLMEIEAWESIPLESSYYPQTGTYVLKGIPPGEYVPFIMIESGYPFNSESGGDFTGRLSGINPNIVITSNQDVLERDLSVVYHIHITSPFDNQERTRAISDEPDNIYQPQAASMHTFAWEPVPDATSYRVIIVLKNDAAGTSEAAANETLDSTAYSLELESTQPDEYYMFSVDAYNPAGELIGLFQYYYTNGSGGWYKFVIHP